MSISTITDWLTFTPASRVDKYNYYIDLPVFSYTGLVWHGASEIITQFNFTASKNFCLLNRPTKPTGADFVLCIRYRVGSTVYRYKLWEHDGAIINAPLYVSQLIKKNFVLEVWSTSGNTTVTNTTVVRTISSVQGVSTDMWNIANAALAVGTEQLQTSPLSDPVLDTSTVSWRIDAADAVQSLGVVISIADKEGNFTMLPDTAAVTYNAVDLNFNGKPSLSFADGASLVQSPLTPFDVEDQEFYMVARQKLWQGTPYYALQCGTGTLFGHPSDPGIRLGFSGGSNVDIAAPVSTVPYLIVGSILNAAVISLEIRRMSDFMDYTVETVSAAETNFTRHPVIGAYGWDIAEIIAYNSPTQSPYDVAVREYLCWKYGGYQKVANISIAAGQPWLDNA